MYCIDKDFLGTPEHIVASFEEIALSSVLLQDMLIEDGTFRPGTLQSYLRLIGREISEGN